MRITLGEGWVRKRGDNLTDELAALGCLARSVRVLSVEPGSYRMERLSGPTWAETWTPGRDRYYTWRFARFLGGFHTNRLAPLPDPERRCRSLREQPDVPGREEALRVFARAPRPWKVLHGDLHHYNLVRHGRRTLAIDPHGWLGPPLAEVGAFLGNPLTLSHLPEAEGLLRIRLAVLAEELQAPALEVARWGMAHAVLGHAWSLEDGDDPAHWRRIAGLLQKAVSILSSC